MLHNLQVTSVQQNAKLLTVDPLWCFLNLQHRLWRLPSVRCEDWVKWVSGLVIICNENGEVKELNREQIDGRQDSDWHLDRWVHCIVYPQQAVCRTVPCSLQDDGIYLISVYCLLHLLQCPGIVLFMIMFLIVSILCSFEVNWG